MLPLSPLLLAAHGVFRALGFRSRSAQAAGRSVHLYERPGLGAAPPALLLHGLGGTAASFLPAVHTFVRACERVLLLELPGHGRAGLGAAAPASIREQQEIVQAVLERELSGPAVLAGSSLGGALALATAALVPDRVRGVIGFNPAGAPLEGADREHVLECFDAATPRGARRLLDRLYARPPRGLWLFSRGFADHFGGPSVQRLVDDLRERAVAELQPAELGALRAKVLVVWGAEDRVLPASSVAWFRAHLPGGRVEVLDGVGHLPMAEAPRRTGALVAEFLQSLR